MTPFLTSKIGHLDRISIFSYDFSEEIKHQPEKLRKLIDWLKLSDEIRLYEITGNGFKTLQQIIESSTSQFRFKSCNEIFPPFLNIQKISNYISFLIRSSFSLKYQRFLNTNIFITEQLKFDLFT